MKTQIIPALVTTLFTAAALHASTIVGDRVQIRRELPSTGFRTGPFTTTVVSGPSDTISVSEGNNMFVNPESNSILFNFGPDGGSGGDYADHAIIVSDIDWFGDPDLTLSSVTATSDIPGFSPSFVTFDAHSVTLAMGTFDWNGGQRVVVLLQVPEPASLSGDYNGNGTVDAADYVVWRYDLGTIYTQADYDLWRAHFGQSAGAPSSAGSLNPAVPEPNTLALSGLTTSLIFCAAAVAGCRGLRGTCRAPGQPNAARTRPDACWRIRQDIEFQLHSG